MKPTKEEIGQLIPLYLVDNDLTVEDFSKKINVSTATIYRWIAGKPMFYRHYIILLSVLRGYF